MYIYDNIYITNSSEHAMPVEYIYGMQADRVSLETVVPPFWKGAASSFFCAA